MILSLKMTNFRKCTDTAMEFGPGLTAIRGRNEISKSTRYEAIGYALFGSEALRESLDDVVTWGEKPSSLKVELRLQVNQSVIDIRRGKSGAELDVDGKLTVTGQKEVTRFVEGVLGTAPKVAGKLMMASQTALRGALSDGPTATAELIERLSNFGLIDEVIQLVVDNLPSGSAVAIEQQVRTLSAQLTESDPGVLDLSALEAERSRAAQLLAAQQAVLVSTEKALAAAKPRAQAVREAVASLARARKDVADLEGQEQGRLHALAALDTTCRVTPDRLDELRRAVLADSERAAARAAWTAVSALKRPDQEWEGDRASFDAAMSACARDIQALQDKQRRLEVEVATTSGKLIRETSCAFCGKDLKDVPEVVQVNSMHGARLAEINAELAATKSALQFAREEHQVYQDIRDSATRLERILGQCGRFVQVLDTHVPAAWVWVGPDVVAMAGGAAQAELQAAEAEVRRHQMAVAKQAALVEEGERLANRLVEAQAAVLKFEEASADTSVLALEQELAKSASEAQDSVRQAQTLGRDAETAIARAQELHQARVQAHARLLAHLRQAEEQLQELLLNNVLLKKLRSARPKVADKLWGVILATVSHYFSQVRGTQSVVTKDDGGFRVDGKPVTGLSGSTLDALGLAIRIALTKTFLPNIDFLMLDEPGAACDDDREANMLGTIATAGFSQVLLVTHSTLADSFADQVITL